MIRKSTFFSIFLATSVLLSCKDNKEPVQQDIAEPITFTKEAEAYLTKETGDTIQHLQLEIADDDYQRETGLMYRTSMEDDQGMIFIFEDEAPRGFYMKNTNIPLDLIFLDANNKVVSIQKNAQPKSLKTIPSEKPAQYVLEVNAGLSDQWNLAVGDSLILNRD
ncbi:DUF192 domain-containing protein [Salinimicrobium sp. MT39]|uniref:DUF192 domain-containing protein n=1 Tax=Salinimicrobium profundisediminis TaxID=2994553 RepID=A0A9X3I223_9FLAO|nr:DUF192 domain-containing protein [Salinimicrobium profundisediminis]MCX2839675.1 DUF192 domain-containing protein [Salinimicrobium profundisediminis]